jgi:hypothetical protein
LQYRYQYLPFKSSVLKLLKLWAEFLTSLWLSQNMSVFPLFTFFIWFSLTLNVKNVVLRKFNGNGNMTNVNLCHINVVTHDMQYAVRNGLMSVVRILYSVIQQKRTISHNSPKEKGKKKKNNENYKTQSNELFASGKHGVYYYFVFSQCKIST